MTRYDDVARQDDFQRDGYGQDDFEQAVRDMMRNQAARVPDERILGARGEPLQDPGPAARALADTVAGRRRARGVGAGLLAAAAVTITALVLTSGFDVNLTRSDPHGSPGPAGSAGGQHSSTGTTATTAPAPSATNSPSSPAPAVPQWLAGLREVPAAKVPQVPSRAMPNSLGRVWFDGRWRDYPRDEFTWRDQSDLGSLLMTTQESSPRAGGVVVLITPSEEMRELGTGHILDAAFFGADIVVLVWEDERLVLRLVDQTGDTIVSHPLAIRGKPLDSGGFPVTTQSHVQISGVNGTTISVSVADPSGRGVQLQGDPHHELRRVGPGTPIPVGRDSDLLMSQGDGPGLCLTLTRRDGTDYTSCGSFVGASSVSPGGEYLVYQVGGMLGDVAPRTEVLPLTAEGGARSLPWPSPENDFYWTSATTLVTEFAGSEGRVLVQCDVVSEECQKIAPPPLE